MNLFNKVLLIDDDESDRRTVQRLLRGRCEVVGAADCIDSNVYLAEQQDIDCVILDYNIPSTDTLGLLKRLVEAQLPVVMLTGEGNESIAVEAMKCGAKDYIVKQHLTFESLERALSGAIERQALEQELAERQKEMEDFAHVASHDLNAPLNKIRLSCELLHDDLEEQLPEELGNLLKFIMNGCHEMSQLINDLLEYSRVGRGSKAFEAVDLGSVVEKAIANLEVEIEDSETIIEVAEMPEVCGDKVALLQLFQNLLSNALKYRDEQQPRIKIGAIDIGGKWQISVADNGIGIAPESQQEIFKAFQRLHSHNEYEGSGIGLATCKKVVDQHGGKLWIDSTPGQGSTFFFTVPSLAAQ